MLGPEPPTEAVNCQPGTSWDDEGAKTLKSLGKRAWLRLIMQGPAENGVNQEPGVWQGWGHWDLGPNGLGREPGAKT